MAIVTVSLDGRSASTTVTVQSGPTLFVDGDSVASSDSITRTQALAGSTFTTPQAAANVAQPGDTILVKPRASAVYPTLDLTNKRLVSPGMVTLDRWGSGTLKVQSLQSNIVGATNYGCEGWTIRNVEFQSTTQQVWLNTSRFHVESCTIKGGCTVRGHCIDVWLKGNLITAPTPDPCSGSATTREGYGLWAQAYYSGTFYGIDGLHVIGNTFGGPNGRIAQDAIQVAGDWNPANSTAGNVKNVEITDNLFQNVWAVCEPRDHSDCIQVIGAGGPVKILRNTFRSIQSGTMIKDGVTNGLEVAYNDFDGNAPGAIGASGIPFQIWDSPGANVHNNRVIHGGLSPSIRFGHDGNMGPTVTGIVCQHNQVDKGVAADSVNPTGVPPTFTTNTDNTPTTNWQG
jgi:hypothetical protein